MSNSFDSSDQVLFEKFRIISCLKKDSYSSVYLADHIYLNKQIILKVLHTAGIPEPSMLERFKREAKIMARLDHPNIIRVLDFGQKGTDFYLSFEFFKSQNLREVLSTSSLDLAQRRNILIQLVQGLSAAHRLGIIHRDIKPENLLLNDRNELKIADFGLAVGVDESALTKKSSIVGTPAYMSPEQIRGESVSAQSDLFAVGIVAWEIFLGSNPFLGKDINATINAILTFDIRQLYEKLENLPEDLQQVIEGCLQRDTKRRYRSADEILVTLRAEKIAPIEKAGNSRYKRHSIYLVVFMVMILLIFIMIRNNKIQEIPFSGDSTTVQADSQVATVIPQQPVNQKSEKIIIQSAPKNETRKAEPILASESGNILLLGTPPATVIIDSQAVGQLPLREFVSLPAGIHDLQLIHSDYPIYKQRVEVQAGLNQILQFNLDTLFGYLNCQIYPWADLYIDGKHRGQSPFLKFFILNPGQHLLTFINPAWPVYTDSVTIVKKETTEIRINLEHVTTPMPGDVPVIK